MLPGPDYIFECPCCGKHIVRGSLTSGNTFGSTLYSDGKRIAPMLPDFPRISKCKKCDTIFWFRDLKEIGMHYPFEDREGWGEDAEEAEFLSIDDYFRAIDSGLVANPDDEFYIRQQIWWAFNDKVRHHHKSVAEADVRCQANIVRLMELMNPRKPEQRIMLAELNRNMGNFDKCLELLSKLKGEQFNWLTAAFRRECGKKNRVVFEFSDPSGSDE